MALTRSASSRLFLLLLLAACVPLAGCEIVGGIFKAGVWVGAIGIILLVVVALFVVSKLRG